MPSSNMRGLDLSAHNAAMGALFLGRWKLEDGLRKEE